jgi:hypothetical protein
LSQWENQDYAEKTLIERLVYRITELQRDIVRKTTWYRHGRSQRSYYNRRPQWQRKAGDGT